MIRQALDAHRNHLTGNVVGPGTADLLRFERVVLSAMAVDHFDIAAPLLCPQAMGRDLAPRFNPAAKLSEPPTPESPNGFSLPGDATHTRQCG